MAVCVIFVEAGTTCRNVALCCLEECCTDSVVLGRLHNVVLGTLLSVVLGTLHNVVLGTLLSVVLGTLHNVVLGILHSVV